MYNITEEKCRNKGQKVRRTKSWQTGYTTTLYSRATLRIQATYTRSVQELYPGARQETDVPPSQQQQRGPAAQSLCCWCSGGWCVCVCNKLGVIKLRGSKVGVFQVHQSQLSVWSRDVSLANLITEAMSRDVFRVAQGASILKTVSGQYLTAAEL